jgi:uncharacterized membrane protein YedE/YeeE
MTELSVSALGGVLIGAAASLLLLFNGRVAGVSGIFGCLLNPAPGERGWRWAFVAGLVGGGLALRAARPEAFGDGSSLPSLGVVIAAGLLVGFGTRLGNGCTSGHGVCGLARGSKRSLAATATFMAAGALAVLVARLAGGAT